MNECSNPGAPSIISNRRLRPDGSTTTLRRLFSTTSSPDACGISAVYRVATSRAGETVNTTLTGPPEPVGVTWRTSTGFPFCRIRISNGAVVPRPIADTVRSTEASDTLASPAVTSTTS
jgi:hypothetical protein